MKQGTRFGKLPHEVIFADEAGWDAGAKYSFNDAALLYVEEYEKMLSATKFVTARREKVSTSTYQKEVPVHTPDEIFRYLGIDPDIVKKMQEAQKVTAHLVTEEMWEEFLNPTEEVEDDWLEYEPEQVLVRTETNEGLGDVRVD